jgi:hypothetical protein
MLMKYLSKFLLIKTVLSTINSCKQEITALFYTEKLSGLIMNISEKTGSVWIKGVDDE